MTLPPNVIRQPRGPEEGKGFQRWVKTRMEPEAKTTVEEKEKATADLADSCEAAISKLTVAPVILTHSDESGSSDDDDDENTEKSR